MYEYFNSKMHYCCRDEPSSVSAAPLSSDVQKGRTAGKNCSKCLHLGVFLSCCRDKWLFVSAAPLSTDVQEVANPSDLFTRDPFEFDTSDPETQVIGF